MNIFTIFLHLLLIGIVTVLVESLQNKREDGFHLVKKKEVKKRQGIPGWNQRYGVGPVVIPGRGFG